MKSQKVKSKNQKGSDSKKACCKAKPISYRLKCAKTANGLSHFVMYGDVDKKQALM